MVKFVEMDQNTSFFRQLAAQDDGPIVLINLFHVAPEDEVEFLKLWREDAGFMLHNGCISGQLHKGTEGSSSYVNVATWESAATMGRAFQSPEFQQVLARYPQSCTASPHIFKKIAVPGVYTA